MKTTKIAFTVVLLCGMALPLRAQHAERRYRRDQVQTFKPKMLDRTPEASGVLTTERSLLPGGLSLASAKQAPRPSVDPEDLRDRQLAQYGEGAHFYAKLKPITVSEDGEPAVDRAAVSSDPKSETEEPEGNGLLAILAWLLAALGVGAYVFVHRQGAG